MSSVEEFADSLLEEAISLFVSRHLALNIEHHDVADQALPDGHDRVSLMPLAGSVILGPQENLASPTNHELTNPTLADEGGDVVVGEVGADAKRH